MTSPIIRHDIPFTDHTPTLDEFRAQVLMHLSREHKTLPPKFFYDERGSQLFDAITQLPEYYPTRTEAGIMARDSAAMRTAIGPRALLIEYGSGSSVKTRYLLDALTDPAGYVPLDISRDHLLKTAERLAIDYPHIPILPVCADYHRPFAVPEPPTPAARRVVYFPGSTIGNLIAEVATELLHGVRALVGATGGLLIGVDLRKSEEILLPAYNDSQGITAAFNKNLLVRINLELGANFALEQFEHQALWNDVEGRIEMYLVSLAEQTVSIGDVTFPFAKGETICTEYSYKYTLPQFAELAAKAKLRVDQIWTDPQQLFSVQYCSAV